MTKQVLKLKERTAVFIDASNIIYGARDYGWRMDFRKLIKYLKERFGARKVFYYAGLDAENKKQLGFYEKLQEFNYILRLVPVKTFKDGQRKGDVDSRMTFEMMKYFKEYDRAIVMTGDGDYYWVLEYLLANKDKVSLLSFPERTARELKRLFKERFTDINKIRKVVELKKSKKNRTDAFKGSVPRYYEPIISKKKKCVNKKKNKQKKKLAG